MAPGQKWRLLVGDAGGYVTARRAGDGDVGARDPRSSLPTLSTHHTFPPSRPRSSRMRCATPVGSYPRLCRPRHPIGCPRSTSWKQPSNQQARACDSRPAHLQPAGALQPSAAKPVRINITFWTLGLSELGPQLNWWAAAGGPSCQPWPASVTAARVSASWLLTKALSWHKQSVDQLWRCTTTQPVGSSCPSRGQSQLAGQLHG